MHSKGVESGRKAPHRGTDCEFRIAKSEGSHTKVTLRRAGRLPFAVHDLPFIFRPQA